MFEGFLFDAAGQCGEKQVRVGIFSPGVKTGNGAGGGVCGFSCACFQTAGRGVGSISGTADNLPDAVLDFLAGNIGAVFVYDPGNSGDGYPCFPGDFF